MKNILFILSIIMFSCGDDDCCINIDTQCYSFDIRQCSTDQFVDDVDESGSKITRESSMKTWLNNSGYEVDKVVLNWLSRSSMRSL